MVRKDSRLNSNARRPQPGLHTPGPERQAMTRQIESQVEPQRMPRLRQVNAQTCAEKLRPVAPLFETSQTSIECAALSAITSTKPNFEWSFYCGGLPGQASEVSTVSDSDRVSTPDDLGSGGRDPVATAPGTDLIAVVKSGHPSEPKQVPRLSVCDTLTKKNAGPQRDNSVSGNV